MSDPIELLDHGFLRLVDHKGSDLDIIRAARVSYDAGWRTGADGSADSKLIKYLIDNRHTSPFEHVVFTFDVKAPIFVFRQWHRHRTWSFSEQSGRYAPMKDEFHVPKPEHIGIQSESSKQARDLGGPVTDVQRIASMDIADACRAAYARYQNLLGLGVPRELARLVLPVSTYSHMFATVDLHNLMHFLTLRLHKHAQYEIRVYAAAILDLVLRVVPVTMGYFIEGLMAKDGYDWWFDPNRNSQNANT